jgi:hypothetical protein
MPAIETQPAKRLAPLPWAPRRASHRYAPSRTPRSTRITGPAEHENSRTGGRAVHGIVPPAFEFRWAQCRVGLPREWPPGELRHSHQAGRRDARRWPKPSEDDIRLTPPQGGEPERRRDQRRTRRQAGAAENGPRGAAAERGFPQGAWRSQAPLKRSRKASGRGATGGRQAPLPWAPGARGGLRRCRCPCRCRCRCPCPFPCRWLADEQIPTPVAPPPSRRGYPESSGRAPPPRRASGETGRCPRIRRASRWLSACTPT